MQSLAPIRPLMAVSIPRWVDSRFAFAFVFGAWVVMPGIRRVFDWHAGFASVSVLSIVPLVALLPFAILLVYGGRLLSVDRRILFCAWLWISGFSFAFVVAVVNGGSITAALYSLAQFILPMAFGLWVATLDLPMSLLFDRVAGLLLWISTPLCLYAVLQFVAPPPWDVEWLRNAHVVSIGIPAPYALRPFSTLNGPEVFAAFLDITMLLNLPRLVSSRRMFRATQFLLCLATLLLTMDRTGWLGLATALVVYIALSPHRARNLAITGAAFVVALLTINASSLLGSSQAGNLLTARFATLSNLSDDSSFIDRQRYFGSLLADAVDQPLGQGLGVIGTAAKLGAVSQVVDFDNGYIARLTEMGFFGAATYVATLVGALLLAFRYWAGRAKGRSRHTTAIAATLVAAQIMFAVLDLSYDNHIGLAGIAFWFTVALVALGERPVEHVG
jgi:putative inorganic carbon (HCO3(-)) transporter